MNERIYYSEAARRRAQRQQLVLTLAVAGLSLSIGAIIALLFAPEAGEDVRQEVRDRLNEILDRYGEASQHIVEDVRDRVSS
ncbi:MAG: YtxH domain-containing protein [Chloroflexota bacterium]